MVADTQTREWTKDNQTKRIREWLKSGKTLTSIQAYDMWGCTRLASRIYFLRSKGMMIETKMVRGKNRFGATCEYAEYFLSNS